MSFCTQIKDELALLHPNGTCCRRSLLYGLVYGATLPSRTGEGITLRFPVPSGTSVNYESLLTDLFRVQYNMDIDVAKETRGAHRYLSLRFEHRQIKKTLALLSEASEADQAVLSDILGFRCKDCTAHFLRGVFLASGTVNDPAKSYHLEIRAPKDGRADLLCSLFMNIDSMPGSTGRRDEVGFIWKSGSAVIELLNFMGATSGVFDILNTQVEREIRNNENRATNCDTRNIERAMSASVKQLTAIGYLEENHLLDSLPPDLQATAKLRLEHPEVSLRELAEMHNPAITKSGLNHRLEKIMTICESIKKQSSDL